MTLLKTMALGAAAVTALALPAMAQYGPRGHGAGVGGDAATIYVHPDFRGKSLRVTGPITHLHEYGFNDKVSSIRIERGTWEVCVDPDFRGRCEILTYRAGELNDYRLNDKITSIRPIARRLGDNQWPDGRRGRGRGDRFDPPPGHNRDAYGRGGHGRGDAPVILFADPQFRGNALPVDGAIPHLNELRFNDKVSSIVVNSGVWEVCTDPNYRGRCEIIDRSVDQTNFYRLNDNITSIRPAARGYRPF
ncbi:beta/gamma crystallin-related protein [Henriciella marina]|uniref:beta/gamma crystallin-related protein n=1 Tax=Henriciella marina TaxID=453851 RepID=UPI000372B9B7|nr:beta/gamma crystallin-related protein [Henriciella marina]